MNNLLCSILFCLTSLCLVNADCSPHPGIINAVVDQTDQCRDITIRCNKGYRMKQVTECIDGEWKYQQPICKPQECGYKFTNRTYVRIQSINYVQGLNQIECDQQCNDNTNCSTGVFISGNCYLYQAPLISITLDTDLDECIEKCNQMKECLILSHWGDYQRCYLFNVTQNNLPNNYPVEDYDDDYTVADKFCF